MGRNLIIVNCYLFLIIFTEKTKMSSTTIPIIAHRSGLADAIVPLVGLLVTEVVTVIG